MYFAAPVSSKAPLLKSLNTLYRREKENELIYLPRVVVEGQLVLQRRQWFIPRALLPYWEGGELPSAYLFRLQEWRKALDIPRYCFSTLHARNIKTNQPLEGLKNDDYKPQYLDFQHSFLLTAWERQLKRVPELLKLEEMLPAPQQLLRIEGKPYATETIVQWAAS